MALDRENFRILPKLGNKADHVTIKEALGDRKVITVDECATLITEYFDPNDSLHVMTSFGISFIVEPEVAIGMMEDNVGNVNIRLEATPGQNGVMSYMVWLS